ncbi:hypothetical protein AB6A23_04240 [Paenibacillus tarimensis]
MRNISVNLCIMLVAVVLISCQQSKQSSEKATNDNYDIAGVVTEVNKEDYSILLGLTKKVQESEEQMWVRVSEDTTISYKNEEGLSFEDIEQEAELKVSLSDECLEPGIRICFAKDIVIQ